MSASLDGVNNPLASSIAQVIAQGKTSGHLVFVVSGRRSRQEQIALRMKNCGTTPYEINDMPSELCKPPTARPGESRHETGNAVDLGGDLEWAARQLAPLGVGRPVKGEAWHFEMTGTGATSSPASPTTSVGSAATGVTGFLSTVSSPAAWKRAGMITLGIALIIGSLTIIFGDSFTQHLPQTGVPGNGS